MQKLVSKINEQLDVFKENADAYATKKNKAAAARARKVSLELTKLFKEFRKKSVDDSKK